MKKSKVLVTFNQYELDFGVCEDVVEDVLDVVALKATDSGTDPWQAYAVEHVLFGMLVDCDCGLVEQGVVCVCARIDLGEHVVDDRPGVEYNDGTSVLSHVRVGHCHFGGPDVDETAKGFSVLETQGLVGFVHFGIVFTELDRDSGSHDAACVDTLCKGIEVMCRVEEIALNDGESDVSLPFVLGRWLGRYPLRSAYATLRYPSSSLFHVEPVRVQPFCLHA